VHLGAGSAGVGRDLGERGDVDRLVGVRPAEAEHARVHRGRDGRGDEVVDLVA
jgi:hypothetical protein